MTIITISRGSYCKGKEIAEKVAEKLGFDCVRREIILETTGQFHLPEIELVRAIHDAPTILDRFGFRKEMYTAYFQNALLQNVKEKNAVYHGLAGHFFFTGISHVLKVRIIADMEDRIQLEMQRENISYAEAQKILVKDDEERRKWSKHLYGINTADPKLYDMVIHIKKFDTDMAADLITKAANMPQFQENDESKAAMEDLFLASEVKVALVTHVPLYNVTSKDGEVHVMTKGHVSQEKAITGEVNKYASNIPGVKKLIVEVSPTMAL